MLSFKVFQNLSLASSWLYLKRSPVLFVFCLLQLNVRGLIRFWFFCVCELFWDYFIEGGVFIHQKAYNAFMSCSFTHFLTKIRLFVYCFVTHFSCWTIYFVHISIPTSSSFFSIIFLRLYHNLFNLFPMIEHLSCSEFSYKGNYSEFPGK